MDWTLLITTLPTENSTARMRAWRALKQTGAAVVRDGVYLMPPHPTAVDALTAIAEDVRQHGGIAWLMPTAAQDGFPLLFDRSAEFGELLSLIVAVRPTAGTLAESVKQARKLRKTFDQLTVIDFFPGEARRQAGERLLELEQALARLASPDEPHPAASVIPRLQTADYQGRCWATRARPWVDRLACAWLIRRWIDPQASFLWLAVPADCPAGVLGFDYDGAAFTHVGARVTFETLLAAFDLETASLLRLGAVVHFLDAGGAQPPEAEGVERILAGLRTALTDDDALLAAAMPVFDALQTAFTPSPVTTHGI